MGLCFQIDFRRYWGAIGGRLNRTIDLFAYFPKVSLKTENLIFAKCHDYKSYQAFLFLIVQIFNQNTQNISRAGYADLSSIFSTMMSILGS